MIRSLLGSTLIFSTAAKSNLSLLPSNTTELNSIGCDVCTFALEKGFSLGCSAGASALSAICLDAEPLCEAAFEALCQVCEADCDVKCWSEWACGHVDLCPSTNCSNPPPAPPPSPSGGSNPPPTSGTAMKSSTSGNTYYMKNKRLRHSIAKLH